MSNRFHILLCRVAAGLLLGAAAVLPQAARAEPPLPGAVFTTDLNCAAVNGNIYVDKGDVYLNGGPSRPGAAGLLPNTSYYVQVTNPSGTQLLGSSLFMPNQTPITTNALGNFTACVQLQAIVAPSIGAPAGYGDTSNPGGVYKVWVSTVSTFDNNSTKTDNFKVGGCTTDCVAGDGSIAIRKFYDANANGAWDAGEPELPTTGLAPYGSTGWKVDLFGFASQLTPASYGSLTLTDYVAREFAPIQANWYATTPTPIDGTVGILNRQAVTLTLAQPTATVTFGNVCTGAGGGLTLGYWSNRNGQATMTTYNMNNQLGMLAGLNLRNANGSNFDPSNYTAFKNWLLSATATNMAYMLSAQLASMELNVSTAKVSSTALVYAPGANTANSSGFALVGALMSEANTELGAHGSTLAGSAFRNYQELLKTALDSANNNLTFVQLNPCQYTF